MNEEELEEQINKNIEKEMGEEFYEKIKEEARKNPEHKKLMEDKEKNQEYLKQEELDKYKIILNECYEDIKNILKEYCDLREDYYSLVSLWIIGTYLHEAFETYPYLFINAMRGSGKTRLLRLITSLAKNGDLQTSLKESVLFRTSKGRTLGIDEFESIGSKENQSLRELLNACYKKGMKVKRMKKVKGLTGEEYQVEEFEPYTPIVMANIWGIEEVLGDRSITMILEKSSNPYFNLIMEDFDSKPEIKDVKARLCEQKVYMCSYFGVMGYIKAWNNYIKQRYNYTTTLTTYTTLTTLTTPILINLVQLGVDELKLLSLFNKIHDTRINGRNLELFLPLFIVANFLGEEILKNILVIGEGITKERREEEMVESKDILLIDFVSRMGIERDFSSVKRLTSEFRDFIGDDETDDKWVNTKWIGRALKRLSLIKEKRRTKNGMEVIPDVDKALIKIKYLKEKKDESKR